MRVDTAGATWTRRLLARPDRLARWAAAWLVACLVLAYGFDLGKGFIADDYAWIAYHRDLRWPGDLRRLFVDTPMGFYRPLVSLSFFANHLMFGDQPFGYAATNFALVLATAAALVALTRALGFGWLAGVFGAALWMFNMHGIGMSVMWISGRTSLLATLFAVLAALAVQRRQAPLGGLWTLAALLSKEEPILLPVVLAAWVAIDGWSQGMPSRQAAWGAWTRTWPAFAALGLYLALRQQSSAMTPADAPSYYALSVAPAVLIPNVLSYADRAATFAAAVLVLAFLGFARRRLSVESREWRLGLKGGIWLVGGFALTVMVPVRSDLYACLPSIGVSLMAVAAGGAVWRQIPQSRQPAAMVAALLLPVALLPIYRARNAPNRRNAIFAEHVVAHVGHALAGRDDISRVALFQDQGERPSLQAAIGGALPVAIQWRTGRHVTVESHALVRETRAPDPPPGTLHVRIARGAITSAAAPR